MAFMIPGTTRSNVQRKVKRDLSNTTFKFLLIFINDFKSSNILDIFTS